MNLRKQYEKETGKKWYQKTIYALDANGINIKQGRKVSEKYVRWLESQLTWIPVEERLPDKQPPTYPRPWNNRKQKPYIVTDGIEARFAYFVEIAKDKWCFVNPHNYREIPHVIAWKDASNGLPIPPMEDN